VGDHRDYFVYTPPGYNATAKTVYPVLYLLHGFSDDASGWTSVGRAHVILDNLLAAGKVKPMLVVMTLGYGEPQILSRTAPRTPDMNRRNLDRFRESLIAEVIPAVERDYRAARDRSLRAIAGLSMGGGESLYTGLNNIDKFAYVGAFSAGGGSGPDYAAMYPGLDGKSAARLKGLWIACGRDDRLIESNKKFLEWLKSKDVKFTWTETGGAHTWMVWRRYLADFTPLLFR
jgi:enterochelin esterase family protein